MKYLVTGGAGFIGSNIVLRLVELGHEVVVFDNLSSGYHKNLIPQVHFIMADLLDAAQVSGAARGCDAIFHLAASVGNKRSVDCPRIDSETNILGTINVLEAARENSIKKVVFSSSAGIFGELKSLPIGEDHPQDPDSPYGTSKLAAEKMCLVYNKLYGMNNICLRYFNVYGRNQRYDAYGNVIPIFIKAIIQGDPLTIFGDGNQTRDFVNVDDVVEANLHSAFAKEIKGVFNIGSGTRVSINELVRQLHSIASKPINSINMPPRLGDVRDSQANIEAASRSLGYCPRVCLRDGLVKYWHWTIEDC